MKTLALFIAFITFIHLGKAIPISDTPSFSCGTVVSHDYLNNYAHIGEHSRSNPVPRLNRKLSVVAHIVKDSLGVPAHTETAIAAAVAGLNPLFDPIKISFAVCDYRYIDNYNFYDLIKEEKEPEMLANFYENNVINLYCVDHITLAGDSVGGYAYMPGGPDVIVLAQMSAIAHEMGHFFGLLHTFDTDNGVELVNGSNCETAGDLICDTDADPYYEDMPMDGCNIEEDLVDTLGVYYVPPTNNIMSYYGCACKFTQGQYRRMAAQFLAFKEHLW